MSRGTTIVFLLLATLLAASATGDWGDYHGSKYWARKHRVAKRVKVYPQKKAFRVKLYDPVIKIVEKEEPDEPEKTEESEVPICADDEILSEDETECVKVPEPCPEGLEPTTGPDGVEHCCPAGAEVVVDDDGNASCEGTEVECPEGEELSESGDCIPVCPEGTVLDEDETGSFGCVPVDVEEPEVPVEEPEVPVEEPEVPVEEPEVPVEEPECPDGEELNESGECVPVCPEGTFLDVDETGSLICTPVEEPEVPVEEPEVPVEEPEVPVEEPEVPVEEPDVPVEEPDVPVEEPECPDGEELNESGECVPVCPEGTFLDVDETGSLVCTPVDEPEVPVEEPEVPVVKSEVPEEPAVPEEPEVPVVKSEVPEEPEAPVVEAEVPTEAPPSEGQCPDGQFYMEKVESRGCTDCDANCEEGKCADLEGCSICKPGYYSEREDPEWPFMCINCAERIPGCKKCSQGVNTLEGAVTCLAY